ncbi:hypothetical protein [Pontibacter rugosus]|uniref:Uncharacterized protein n=1 Tax=Pontibacter rugosus TaxID=1745966 RepID=A0ABW3SPV1_9BACT
MYILSRVRVIAALGLLCCALTSCETITEVTPKADATVAQTQSLGETIYTISKGSHYSDNNGYKKLSTSSLKFEATFDSTAVYKTIAANNQGDINKLYGLSDCNTSHHTNSARFGWRWYNNRLEILAYTYLNKKWQYKLLDAVPIGKPAVCEIKMEDSQYRFIMNGKEVVMPRACSGAGAGYQLYPYFGGDEVAPHAITIKIKEIQ